MASLRFKSLVLDVDSTLSAIEGIDWLASLRSESVRRRVAEITERAMSGEVALGSIYAERLAAVMPTREEIGRLGSEYVERMEESTRESLAELTNIGVKVVLVSAGIREAILPLASVLGVPSSDVHAVRVYFTESGNYAGFNAESPLTQNGGKATVVRGLGLPRPILAVGDGLTDAELRTIDPPAVDAFAAYTGVVERAPVVRVADYTIRSFEELPALMRSARGRDCP
jgi:Phosphoserine phosphatase